MATRKKTKKNNSRKKSVAPKKSKSAAAASSRRVAGKAKTVKSKTAKTKPKRQTSQAKSTKNTPARSAATGRPAPRNTNRVIRGSLASRGEQSIETINLQPKGLDSKSGGQSGALQGLSDIEGASSESVDELLEEGNAFEAEVVKGVEDAPDADEGEVRTHERPQEEDLPEDFREN
jgi:N utilization substance protein A